MGIEAFLVDENIKKELKKAVVKSRTKYNMLCTVKNLLLVITFCIPMLFLIYAYTISDKFVHLNDYYALAGTKNHLFIWTCAVTAFVILLFLFIVVRMLYNGIACKEIVERLDESLFLEDNILSYGYRLKMQSYADERVVVKIPLNEVEYQIDKQDKKITFKGNLFSQFYKNYSLEEIAGKGDYISKIVLYDYFEPSLISVIVNKNK